MYRAIGAFLPPALCWDASRQCGRLLLSVSYR
nr:MAG TPA: hypothetical protein [Caudoviricetes sp.]